MSIEAGAVRRPLRALRRSPRYAIACAASLALAVAATTATLSVIRRAFVDALPYRAGDALVTVYTVTETMSESPVAVHVLDALRAGVPSLSAYMAARPEGIAHTRDGVTEQLIGVAATAEFFDLLARPALGRAWTPDETDAVVVSWGFWRRALGGAPDVTGMRITIDGAQRTVVGVLPESFLMPYWWNAAVVRPLDVQALRSEPRARRQLTLLARRGDGATKATLAAELAHVTDRLRADEPEIHARQRWVAVPLRSALIGPARPALIGTAAAAALLLLIAGANVASLSAVRALSMRGQLSVRAALGATRARILREHAAEGIVLVATATAAGLWLGALLTRAAAAMQGQFLARMTPIDVAASTLAVAGFAGLLVGLLAATLPFAILLARGVGAPGRTRGATAGVELAVARNGLVVTQVALALVLLVGAGLLVRTVRHLSTTELGFRSAGVSFLSVDLPDERYAATEAQLAFERRVVDALAGLPGVASASSSVGAPVVGGMRAGLLIRGREDEDWGEVAYFSVAPGWMRLLDVPVVAGRDLAPADVDGAPPVMLINETMARRYWPQGDALGARIHIGPDQDPETWMTVVGIVADIRQHGPASEVLPTAFGSTLQYSWPRRHFLVRMRDAAPPPTAQTLRETVAGVDPAVPIGATVGLDDAAADDIAQLRLVMRTLSFFAVTATLLCALGLYAVTSHASRLRRREYAIRLALGADAADVRRIVIRHGLTLGGAGALAGMALAFAGTRLIQGLLHGVAALDPTTFAAASAGVLILAVAAVWGPAREAGRVDPALTLAAD
jgi:putative ABC transport system permease protein